MENFIKKNMSMMIAIFVLLGPVLDLLTGICLHVFKIDFTIGIVVRVFFLVLMCYITLFIYEKRKAIIPYSIILIYMIFYIVGMTIYKNDIGLIREIQGLIKVFYYPILLISFYEIRDEIKISTMTLFTTLFLYLIFIFVPLLLGIGFDTYEITKAGTLGFYNSANEISGIISILTPIMFIVLVESKRWIPRIILAVMYLVVILMIGTKTPLLTLGITIFMSIIYFWVKCFKKKQYKKIGISLGILLVGCMGLILIIPKTTFYKNIEVHLKFLKVDEVEDVLENEKVFDHFIFSQRLTFLHNKNKIYKKANTYQKLFGIGYLDKDLEEYKMVEMDYFDVLYDHGVVGFIIFMSICLYVLHKLERKRYKASFSRYMYDVSTVLIFLLALITGHILTAPAVSLIVIMILLNNYHSDKKMICMIKDDKDKLLDIEDSNIKVISPKNYSNIVKVVILKVFNYHNYDYVINYLYKDEKACLIMDFLGENKVLYITSKDKLLVDKKSYNYLIFNNSRIKNEFIKNNKGTKTKSYSEKDFINKVLE